MKINKQVLKDLEPCIDRWKNYLKHYSDWEGTRLGFLDLENISSDDKLWVLLREKFIPENDLHELACKFAESVLPIFEKEYPDDKCPRLAIEAKRKWLKSEISDHELRAAWAAARAARESAARAAARESEKEKQLELIRAVLKELDNENN